MRHAHAALLLSIVASAAHAESGTPAPPGTETRSITASDGHRCVAKTGGRKPAFRQSLRAMYWMSGEVSDDDEYAAILRHEQYGIVNLELNGKKIVIVDDFTPLSTPARFAERFRLMCDLEKLAQGTLQAIEFYKFRPDDKIGPPTPVEIAAITRKRNERAQQGGEAAQRLPDKDEVSALFRREWSVAGRYPSLGTSFGFEGSRFGEINGLLCDRAGELFRCAIGVTFLYFGEARYGRRTVLFRRDLDHCCELQRYVDPVEPDDTMVGPPPKRPSIVKQVLDSAGPEPF